MNSPAGNAAGRSAAGFTFRRGAGIMELTDITLGTCTRIPPAGAGAQPAPTDPAVSDQSALTGVTVIVPPANTVAGVDVRGGGPATHETSIMAPGTLPYGVDAIVLSGGSAFGLVTAHGAQQALAEAHRGFPAPGLGDAVVPIVPAASIFDLGRGGPTIITPTTSDGYRATRAALAAPEPQPADAATTGSPEETCRVAAGPAAVRGSLGAGTGAWTGRGVLRGGQGSVVITTPGSYQVAALVVANPMGTIFDAQGHCYAAGVLRNYGLTLPTVTTPLPTPAGDAQAGGNTTIACIITDARLDAAHTTRVAASAHAGLARAINPSHTLFDGDTVFALATGIKPVPADSAQLAVALVDINIAAADALSLAIIDAVCSAAARPPDSAATPVAALAEVAPEVVAAWSALP